MRYLLVREDTYVADDDSEYNLMGTTLSVTEDGGSSMYSNMIEGKDYNEDNSEEINIYEQECDGEYDLQIVTHSIKVISEEEYYRYAKVIRDYEALVSLLN